MFRTYVAPFFAQHPGNVANVVKRQRFVVGPVGFALAPIGNARSPRPFVMVAGQMGDRVFAPLIHDRFLDSSDGKDKGLMLAAISPFKLIDQVHVSLGAIGSVAQFDEPNRRCRRREGLNHVAKQGIFGSLIQGGFRGKMRRKATGMR